MKKFGVWTKVKDRLPTEPLNLYDSESYLCTVVNNQVVAMKYIKTELRNKEVVRWEWCGRVSPWEVIAWMPFPDAYKEQ